jgi:two-component system, NtrC family, response regulator GlrR
MASDVPPTKSDDTPRDANDGGAPFEGGFELWIADGTAGGRERCWRFAGDQFSIGSHPSNELVLEDAAVSRFHCEVRSEGEAVLIRDLGSRNGTFVDGVRVKEAYLGRGSTMQVGRQALRFGGKPAPRRTELSAQSSFGGLVGESVPMRAAFGVLERAAQSQSTVLLEGETGTGKGEAALGLHTAGARKNKPFIVLDCGAIPQNLVESEVFGHERGAFTGADAARVGAFEAANGGTVFLDEVGELPLAVQPKLLRVIEERHVRRLGSSQVRPVDVRVLERCLVLEQQPPPREADEPWGLDATAALPRFQDARSRALAGFERHYLELLLEKHGGKVAAAAETAGLSRVYLYRLLGRYGLLR